MYKAGRRFERLPDTLVSDPWRAINEYFEGIYPKAGKKVFRYGSLQAISAYAPKFEIKGQEKRIAISILLLGNSGSGKSSLMGAVEDITPSSYFVSQESEANMEQELVRKGESGVTVIVNDMKRMLGDSGRIKALESMIGDGRISRKNTQYQVESDNLDISLIGGAVPSDVSKQIGGGLLFRMVPITLDYRKKTDEAGEVIEDEAEEVGRQIVMDTGKSHEMDLSKQDIARYYNTLAMISKGEMNDVKRPVGYSFDDEDKKIIFNMWNNLRNGRGWDDENLNWNRELLDGIRFACLSAFLNWPNRKKVNKDGDTCLIKVSRRDAELASQLMKQEMGIKWQYIRKNLLQEMDDLGDLAMQDEF